MGKNASEVLVERLVAWGVGTVYGLPGDDLSALMDALHRHREDIRFVLVHHEEAAAFMASAHAKATGRIGVCLASGGPGGIRLLNGLYDAKLDHQPVLAVTGSQKTGLLGTAYRQEVNLPQLYQDVTEYNVMVTNSAQLPSVVDNATRTAYARKGVTHINIPSDIQMAPAQEDPYIGVPPARKPRSASYFKASPAHPRETDVRAAVKCIEESQRPAILVGVGAKNARHEVLLLAERISAPIIKTLPGKSVIPDASAYYVGGIGLLAAEPAEKLVNDCDLLIMVGTNFPYAKHLPPPGQAKVVQIESDPARAGMRMDPDALVVGSSRESLCSILGRTTPHLHLQHLHKYQEMMKRWRQDMTSLEDPQRYPIAPQYLVRTLSELASDDAVLTCDSGPVAAWAARHWEIKGLRDFFLSGNLAAMACGLPYANALKLAHPDRQVVTLLGGGAFLMLMGEFLTALEQGLAVKVVVNNYQLPGPQADYAAWARACGAFGEKAEQPTDLSAQIEAFLSHDGPALLDVHVDESGTPMPGQKALEGSESFT